MQSYEKLEKKFSAFNQISDSERMVCCSSGTAALHLAFEVLRSRLDYGKKFRNLKDQILVPDYAMVSCPRAVSLAGFVPAFVDCEPDRFLIDPDAVDEGINDKTRAILAVHNYGRRCEMDTLSMLADKHSLYIIEDLAEAHGIFPHPLSFAACWSFYKNKIVAGEEGGAVLFSTRSDADLARKLRCVGFTEDHDYTHIPRGHNYRMSNVHADLVLSSLEQVEYNQLSRRLVEGTYDDLCPLAYRTPRREAVWVYDIRINNLTAEKQKRVVQELREARIPVRFGFKALHGQEEFQKCRTVVFPAKKPLVSSKLSSEVLYFPVDPSINADQQGRQACNAFRILRDVLLN